MMTTNYTVGMRVKLMVTMYPRVGPRIVPAGTGAMIVADAWWRHDGTMYQVRTDPQGTPLQPAWIWCRSEQIASE
jgi:hypothetical protein